MPHLTEATVAEWFSHGPRMDNINHYERELAQVKAFTDAVVSAASGIITSQDDVQTANDLLDLFLKPLVALTWMMNESEVSPSFDR